MQVVLLWKTTSLALALHEIRSEPLHVITPTDVGPSLCVDGPLEIAQCHGHESCEHGQGMQKKTVRSHFADV